MNPLDIPDSLLPWVFWRHYRAHRVIKSKITNRSCAPRCFCCATYVAHWLGIDDSPWAKKQLKDSDGFCCHSEEEVK